MQSGIALAAAPISSIDNGGAYPEQPVPPGTHSNNSTPPSGGTKPGQQVKPTPKPTPQPPTKNVSLTLLPSGLVSFPTGTPLAIQKIVQSANRIVGKPYLWGGGHLKWEDKGYDCSGAVSYALYGAGLITDSMVSGEMMFWGQPGIGKWVTIYAHENHVFMHILNLRLDTSWVDDPSGLHGVRWRPIRTHLKGFTVRHPAGL